MILTPKPRRKIRIGLVAGGLGTYWPQFPHLLPQLEESARYVSERFQEMDAEVRQGKAFPISGPRASLEEGLREGDLSCSMPR